MGRCCRSARPGVELIAGQRPDERAQEPVMRSNILPSSAPLVYLYVGPLLQKLRKFGFGSHPRPRAD